MPSLIDVKPIGAFVEYTIKPLIDYSHDLLDRLDEHGIKARDLVKPAIRLFIFDKLVTSITSILITGMICLTVLHCLHTTK